MYCKSGRSSSYMRKPKSYKWRYGESFSLNESSFQLYTNEESKQGSLSSAKACQSCSEEFGAIIRQCATMQCMHKPSCARTRAISQHFETSHCTHRPEGARTWVRTMSSSKRGAGGVRQEQSADTVRRTIVRTDQEVREHESEQCAAARDCYHGA